MPLLVKVGGEVGGGRSRLPEHAFDPLWDAMNEGRQESITRTRRRLRFRRSADLRKALEDRGDLVDSARHVDDL